MNRTKPMHFISLLLNTFIVVTTVLAFIHFMKQGVLGGEAGCNLLRYFTNLSNIFCAITCIPVIFYNIRGLSAPRTRSYNYRNIRLVSQRALTWKLVGTTAVALTFVMVVIWILPLLGKEATFASYNLFFHAINPVLAIVSFAIFDRGITPKWSKAWKGALPAFLYGIAYILLVFVLKKWPDLYGFDSKFHWYIMMPVMLVGCLVLGYLINLLHALFNHYESRY